MSHGVKARRKMMNRKQIWGFAVVLTIVVAAGCSSPLTTREKGGLIGGAAGAGTGAIIGSTVGHAAVGA